MTTCNVPINIIRQQVDKCNLKCKLWYKYGDSSCLLSNKKDKITIAYDGKSDVMFNSVPYTPTEIRIYKPSIHSYDGEYAEGEIIIMHSGGQNGLAVCIPITMSQTMKTSAASELLEQIINNTPETSEAITINLQHFNANELIPQAGYFTYVGPVIAGNANIGYTCDSNTNVQYVVFHQRHGSISLKQETIDNLGTLINDSFMPIYEGQSFYNEKGTTENGFTGEGQIYIDCQPTDADAEIVYEQPPKKTTMEWIWGPLLVMCGILLAWFGWKFSIYMWTNASNLSKNMSDMYDKAKNKCLPK